MTVVCARCADRKCLSAGDDQRPPGYLARRNGNGPLTDHWRTGHAGTVRAAADGLPAQSGQQPGRAHWRADLVRQPACGVGGFNAVRDADNPQLVKVQGVSGLGLRLEDEHGREVRLGSRGAPLLLTPGQSALTYRVATERTLAELIAGRYRAVVDFHLSYD